MRHSLRFPQALLCLTFTASLTSALHAQTAAATPPLPHERVVKGAPFCAEAVRETVQWLPDANGAAANRIVRRSSTPMCRDGEGNTRHELDANGRKTVVLHDVASREVWLLDPERKTARRQRALVLSVPGVPGSVQGLADVVPHGIGIGPGIGLGGDMREFAARMREWAREYAEKARAAAGVARIGASPAGTPVPLPPLPMIITSNDGSAGAADTVAALRVRIEHFPGPDSPHLSSHVDWRAQTLAPRGAAVTSSLGSKDIEGQRANGERSTWTIEAGKLGNDKPIVMTRDVWTAPELLLTVLSHDIDPRSGETIYRLQNIKRGEPDAALMRVPADYSVAPVKGRAPAAEKIGN
jgi:hypothetical protein